MKKLVFVSDLMKKMILTSICMLIFLSSAAGDDKTSSAGDRAHARILVLGFKSKLIGNLQDRILRETIMREFLERGYSIVPIMDIEGLLLVEESDIRKLMKDNIRKLCVRFASDYAVSGELRIAGGSQYADVAVFRKSDDKFVELKIQIARGQDFQKFCGMLAHDIAERSEKEIILPGGKK
jgi:hypothetical protein